jgi:hypothetical protein
LGDPAPEVSLETVEAALDLNKEVFVAPIRAAWRETSDPFRKAALAYGLRGLDPAFQEPNPFWEQRLLKGELKMATSEADRQRILERLKRVQAEIPAKGP